MYVSVSAYNDATLLSSAIASIREVLPDAHVAVVDGRYETWPEGAANSTDETAAVADAQADSYHPDGPYPRENDKHRHRVALAPADEWTLFCDADERLLQCPDPATLPQRALFPRIYNALCYGPVSVYWPRLFKPAWVTDIHRWDKYLFDVPGVDDAEQAQRFDPVTLVHRHDLRDRDYREAKIERFHNEGRKSRYELPADEQDQGQLDAYLAGEWGDVDFAACPRCGQATLTRSQATAFGTDTLSAVECCIRGDGCYRGIDHIEIDRFEYLPDDWEVGLDENPARLRCELVLAGCGFAATTPVEYLAQYRPAIGVWLDRHEIDTPVPMEGQA